MHTHTCDTSLRYISVILNSVSLKSQHLILLFI